MDVIFAPDWSDGVPYQRLLAESLREHGVNVRFLYGYTDFESCLRKALATPPDFKAAAGWRETTNWSRVAGLTLEGYRRAMKGPRPRL